MFSCSALILKQEKLTNDHYLLTYLAPEMSQRARPGQFVHVRCGDTWDPLLRRPLSLHGIDPEAGTLSLLYRVVGRGTERLSRLSEGECLEVMGPLGRGFQLIGREAIVIGGGIGVAPLLPLVQVLIRQGIQVTVLLGARSQEGLLAQEAFQKTEARVEIATDDGTFGVRGTVVDLLQKRLESYSSVNPGEEAKRDICVYACGPVPMLSAIWQICQSGQIPLQLSLEERMGCGVGACLACVCRVKVVSNGENQKKQPAQFGVDAALTSQDWKYARVCVEGPVFWGKEVILDATRPE
ncbi:MAG: dihydroorotate dehydrogenase electron transfer subunit [Syntrophomonadaceae bacterium]|nr:dihydroorotate dehydrogenase electron transfer subunit [Syntrophomonadaceae bacterium]